MALVAGGGILAALDAVRSRSEAEPPPGPNEGRRPKIEDRKTGFSELRPSILDPRQHGTRLAAAQELAPFPAPADRLAIPAAHRYVGTASCAASNCHGRPQPGRTRGAEYTIWIQQDPHSRAYSVLFNEQSQQIAAKLGLKSAHEADVCLNCHTINAQPHELAADHRFTLFDGVGCEACHGPAADWLEPHKRIDWNDPRRWSAAEKARLGFVNTDDILTRARLCTSCHVGDAGKDVNHDLIAAGHPRLNFELAAFHANLPKHWSQAEDRRAHPPSLEGKLWRVGQAVAAESAARLTALRAANPHGVWPEFTEYGCFACHHNLSVSGASGLSWRQEYGFPQRKPGQYPWATWQTAVLPLLAAPPGGIEALAADVGRVQDVMGRPIPDRDEAARSADALADRLDEWAARLNADRTDPAELRALLTRLVEAGETPSRTWDEAAQIWLGAVSIHQALLEATGRAGGPPSPATHAIQDAFERIRRHLEFAQSDSATSSSPEGYGEETAEALAAEWSGIQQHLSQQ